MSYCLMSVSGYGVALLDKDSNVVKSFPIADKGERIYGLDYNHGLKTILVGFKTHVIEIDRDGKEVGGICDKRFKSIHSAFYSNRYYKGSPIILSDAETDSMYICRYNEPNFKWDAKSVFTKGEEGWTHLNYARYIDRRFYITTYNHPFDIHYKGAVLVLNATLQLEAIYNHGFDRPHAAIPFIHNHLIVANTGSHSIDIVNNNGLLSSYNIEQPDFEMPEDKIKYISGPHFLEWIDYSEMDVIFAVIPNLRCVRVINIRTQELLEEFNLPKEIYGDAGIGFDPRPFQAVYFKDNPFGE